MVFTIEPWLMDHECTKDRVMPDIFDNDTCKSICAMDNPCFNSTFIDGTCIHQIDCSPMNTFVGHWDTCGEIPYPEFSNLTACSEACNREKGCTDYYLMNGMCYIYLPVFM